jgi:hypothetical protein
MNFISLTLHLRPIAAGAKTFFTRNWGIGNFEIEKPIDRNAPLQTTLYATTNDHHYLCLIVTEVSFQNSWDSFVIFCRDNALPVKLFLVYASGSEFPKQQDILLAKNRGVGILQVDESGNGTVLLDPLSLSLTSLRPVGAHEFPRNYREAVTAAESTFKNGDPSKGCAKLYEEIEALSRKLARITHQKRFWRSYNPARKFSGKKNWGPLMKDFMNELDNQKCPGLPITLVGAVFGLTAHRNDSSHKPETMKKLIERDRRLRTRFETARDILSDLIEAGKKIK